MLSIKRDKNYSGSHVIEVLKKLNFQNLYPQKTSLCFLDENFARLPCLLNNFFVI